MRRDALDTLAPSTIASRLHPINAEWPDCERDGWCDAMGGSEWVRVHREWDSLPAYLKTNAAGFIRWRANASLR